MTEAPRAYWNSNASFHAELVADAATRGGRVLDVGCGEGLLVERLVAVCDEVVGIDADAASIERAQDRLRGRPRAADAMILERDVLDAGLVHDLGVFETVTCVATLHHLPLEEGMDALAELVAPGGRLRVIGVAADRTPADWLIAGLTVVPNWLAARAHREVADVGVRVRDPQESLGEIRAASARRLPGRRVRRRMHWRYDLTWDRPAAS